MQHRQPYTFDRVIRLLITTTLFILALWLIYTLRGVLLPFGVACLIAYLFEPFVQYNRRLLSLRKRVTSVFVTLFEATFLFGILCYFLAPSIMNELHQVGELFIRYATSDTKIPFLPDSIHQFLKETIDFQKLSTLFTRQDWMNIAKAAFSFISSGFSVVIDIFSWLLVFLYVVFIMLDYDKLMLGFRHMVPPRYRRATYKIGRDIKSSMNHYFRGQALVAFCVGILFSIGFLIIGLPLAIVLGLFIGLLNMVPYLQLISIPMTAILCLVYSVDNSVDFWPIFWASMAVYIIVQAIQDLFLTPKIMGKAMGLNPAIILLSLSIWGTLLGLLGMIIALPMTTLILSYYETYVLHNRNGESSDNVRKDQQAIERMTGFPDR